MGIIGTWQSEKDSFNEISFYIDKTMHKKMIYGSEHIYRYKFISRNAIKTTEPCIYNIVKLTSEHLILNTEYHPNNNIMYKRIAFKYT
jgi:hypothetical protein